MRIAVNSHCLKLLFGCPRQLQCIWIRDGPSSSAICAKVGSASRLVNIHQRIFQSLVNLFPPKFFLFRLSWLETTSFLMLVGHKPVAYVAFKWELGNTGKIRKSLVLTTALSLLLWSLAGKMFMFCVSSMYYETSMCWQMRKIKENC